MGEVRICFQCRSALHRTLRADAVFCGDHCRSTANKLLGRLPTEIHDFCLALRRLAPTEAFGYRVGIAALGGIYFYPGPNGIRWHGKRSGQAAFLLRPFEPPCVPIAGVYGIESFARDGTKLRTPAALLTGGQLIPFFPFDVTEGERWQPKR